MEGIPSLALLEKGKGVVLVVEKGKGRTENRILFLCFII
jgi:hypothetical protein